MMNHGFNQTDAVSPVVGVMLMLVIVIIIAAVVSAFAGGIASSTGNAPRVQITGTYSQANGMMLENNGPDVINTQEVTLWTRLSGSFGQATHASWQVNKSTIFNTNNPVTIGSEKEWENEGHFNITKAKGAWQRDWGSQAGLSGAKTWGPGERIYIRPPYHTASFLQPGASASSYGYNVAASLNKVFFVEVKSTDGKIIASAPITIQE